eukprot:4001901-Amphidinium_carterae.1
MSPNLESRLAVATEDQTEQQLAHTQKAKTSAMSNTTSVLWPQNKTSTGAAECLNPCCSVECELPCLLGAQAQ